MILTDEQQQAIKPHVASIEKMGSEALADFSRKLYMAKEDFEPTVFNWILGVIDDKHLELSKQVSIEAVSSEIKADY